MTACGVKFASGSLSDMVNLTRANDAASRFNETVDREQRGRQKPVGRGYSDLNDEGHPHTGAGSMNVDTAEPVKKRRPRSISELDKRSLEKLERRGLEFQRNEAIRSSLVVDLGGEDAVSVARALIANKCAFHAMKLENMQIASLSGEEIDLKLHGELTDRLRRGLESIGLERKHKDITPTLAEYLASKPTSVPTNGGNL
jgi:hypothetical protein